MLSCREATRLMSASQERRLGLIERVRLQLHWRICAACRNFNGQLGVLRDAMRRYAKRSDDESQ